ncbi:MAG TPA: hypothetical protein VMU05_09915 [Dongiaceae bacterium]|nr:hypothetical protein [Dongiaceae bacterium]
MALLSFYSAAVLSVITAALSSRIPTFRLPLLVLSGLGTISAIFLLLRFLCSNDEHERLINYRALTFAFVGTLLFSAAIGFLQSFGFHPISWLGIPPLMIILWSFGLILYSWRYR